MQPLSVTTHFHDNKLHSNSFHGISRQSLINNTDLRLLEHGGSLEDFHKFKYGYDCTSSQLGSMETVENLNTMDAGEVPKTSKLFWSFGKKDISTKTTPPKPAPRMKAKDDSHDGNYNYHTVEITLAPLEPRFGFSVSGGADESFPARIDNISKGRLFIVRAILNAFPQPSNNFEKHG